MIIHNPIIINTLKQGFSVSNHQNMLLFNGKKGNFVVHRWIKTRFSNQKLKQRPSFQFLHFLFCIFISLSSSLLVPKHRFPFAFFNAITIFIH